MSHHKVIIIGSGPAGLTAAIYAARAELSPLVFEGQQPGGQLTITTDVENYPGFPKGIMGPEMMGLFRDQAVRFGAKTLFESVERVELGQNTPHRVWVGPQAYTCDALIISTGASAKLLGLEKEKELMGYGVSACATCDGFFYKEKAIAVVGGGDTAMEEALFLTKFAKKVSIIHRRSELRASKIMQKRALEHPKIEVIWDSQVIDITGTPESHIQSLTLKNTQDGTTSTMPIDGLFIGIGHKPNSELFEGKLEMDDVGYLITRSDSSQTSVAGVFACGDVQDAIFRQAVTAAGSGCMAAIETERYLAQKDET